MSLIGTILDSRRERRFESLPAEGVSQNPSQSLIEALGGTPSLAGVPVTIQSVSGIPAVFACDKVISEDIAKTPIKIKRKNTDGTRADDVNSPVYGLLHDLANPVQSAYEFKELMQSSLNLWGNAYAEIQRNARNEPVALWPLEPGRMTVELNSLNQLVYRYSMAAGQPKEWLFNAANPPIFHLRQNAIAPRWWLGRSPIKVLRDAFGLNLAQERYQARHFGQGGHAQMQITGTSPLTPEAAKAIIQDYEKVTRGEQNWHRPVMLPFGFEAKPLAMPHRDAQFADMLKLSRSQAAGIFRVSAHKINDLDKATFSNIEHLNIAHVGDCLGAHFKRWTQAIARDLLNPKSFNTHFAVFKIDELIRGDFKTLTDGLSTMRQNGVVTANDWLRIIDSDDQIPADKGGDDHLVNGTMVPMRRDPATVMDDWTTWRALEGCSIET